MANEIEKGAHKVEQHAMNSGDAQVSKINFSDVMQPKDNLADAWEKNLAAIASATAKVAAINERVKTYFGEDKTGYDQFQKDQKFYTTA